MLDDFMLRRAIRSFSFVLGPGVMENCRGNHEADQNANEAVADFVKIGIGCVALEHAEEKSECDLETGVTNAFAAGCHPRGDCADCGNEDDQRRDRLHARNQKHDGEERERAADHATDDS